MATFEQEIESDRKLREAKYEFHCEDGLHIMALKCIFYPSLFYHRWVFMKLVAVFETPARLIAKKCKSDPRLEDKPIFWLATDMYVVAMGIGLLVAYVIVYHAMVVDTCTIAILIAWMCILFSAFRIYEFLSVIVGLHSQHRYTTDAPMRAAVRTFWHYGKTVVAFATFYLTVGHTCGEHFSKSDKWPASWFEPIYFSFITIATVGYGDLSPSTTTGRTLVVIEVSIGLFLLLIGLQRVLSAQGKSDTKDNSVPGPTADEHNSTIES